MPLSLVPWEPHCWDPALQSELNRRRVNRGFNFIKSSDVSWKDDNDQWNQYRGPMTAWVRVCSNGVGLESRVPLREGFVFYGGKDFYTGYGFNSGFYGAEFVTTGVDVRNKSVIGYTPDGAPHIIDNDLANSQYPIHVPPPEVEKVTAIIQKELLRKVRIEWVCFSSEQLSYMTPYFLVPGISMIVEWGWNHFNPMSLVDLKDPRELSRLFNNPYPLYTENVLNSKGNYEVVFGIVTNFEWSIEGNKIRCSTEVTSKDRLWAGQLIDSNMIQSDNAIMKNERGDIEIDEKKEDNINVIDSLRKFVEQYLEEFKNLVGPDVKEENAPNLKAFISYLKKNHKQNYEDYLYGLYFGRDEKSIDKYANKEDDFDLKSPRKNFWINMGLIVEIINFHASKCEGVNNKELFRVDVDDCVICAHPNLISSNGDILLIPNQRSPKYFSGMFGYALNPDEYRNRMLPCTETSTDLPKASDLDPNEISPSIKWADYRIKKICIPLSKIQRDDISSIINDNRIRRKKGKDSSYFYNFEFPFSKNYVMIEDGNVKTYESNYTGFFKDLYLNAAEFKNIIKDSSVTKFIDIYREIFYRINSAASEFWQLKLAGSTGRQNISNSELATMKVVDDKLAQYTSNRGVNIFTFDYNAADGLIQSINFRPMLSNAQAIRTIYAQTNLTNKQQFVISGHNELLDYKFRDRLFKIGNQESHESFYNSSFKSSMSKLQSLSPDPKAFQVTRLNERTGEVCIYRLAIPRVHSEVLTLLLDDNDKGHNPRYCGIMPGIQAEFTIQGISGIRTFSMFRVRGLPEPYSEENVIFRTINVNDTIQGGQWITTIVAGVLPLRGYFRSKLGLPLKEVKKSE